jgi:hypothetical protein
MSLPGEPSSVVATAASLLRPNAKLFLMSAYSREMIGDIGSASNVRAFVRKPFQIRDLLALIREALST